MQSSVVTLQSYQPSNITIDQKVHTDQKVTLSNSLTYLLGHSKTTLLVPELGSTDLYKTSLNQFAAGLIIALILALPPVLGAINLQAKN